jgi:hypothetical protein
MSGGHFLHPKPKDMICYGEEINLPNSALIINAV